MKESSSQTALLLIGFNRLELFERRLGELSDASLAHLPLCVALDGPRTDRPDDYSARELIIKRLENDKQTCPTLILREVNLGCDTHIPLAIDELLEKYESIVVIEDDVCMDPRAILEIANQISFSSEAGASCVAIGMSSITRLPMFRKNEWRSSKFFSAWGFAINRAFWRVHKQVLIDAEDTNQIEVLMENSKSWKNLNKRKQRIWQERFKRGNYDYKIQQTLFAKDMRAKSPLFRLVSNEGHGDEHSTHTRFQKPHYLRKEVSSNSLKFSNETVLVRFPFLNILDFLDSNTWAGDGLLSVRGRTFGIRSLARRLIGFVSRSSCRR